MATTRIEKRLRKAMQSRRYVRLSRSSTWDELSGYIAGVGSKWVLLAHIDDAMRPNGFCALRLRDIIWVRRVTTSESFHRRALERHGHWPPPAAPVVGAALDRTGSLVGALADTYPLLSLFVERDDPNVCFIGRPAGYRRKSLALQEISPDAKWDVGVNRYDFRELTRIDGGDGYAIALREVGGKPPQWSRRSAGGWGAAAGR